MSINKIDSWAKEIINGEKLWEANNLHVDEISDIFIDRKNWVQGAFSSFEYLNIFKFNENLFPFIHFDLIYTDKPMVMNEIDFKIIHSVLGEYTPPSLNIISRNYFEEFKHELNHLDLINEMKLKTKAIFYRSFYDLSERKYSNELYVFNRNDIIVRLNS